MVHHVDKQVVRNHSLVVVHTAVVDTEVQAVAQGIESAVVHTAAAPGCCYTLQSAVQAAVQGSTWAAAVELDVARRLTHDLTQVHQQTPSVRFSRARPMLMQGHSS